MPSSPARPLAPAWMPRPLRRRVDRQLRKLVERDACSLCGAEFPHNTRMFGGLDRRDTVALTGECCADRLDTIFFMGLASSRSYDFLRPRETGKPIAPATSEQLATAIAAYQQVIAATDQQLDGVARRSGVRFPPEAHLLDSVWKDDDRTWFAQNPTRSHRVRMPFPGEADAHAAQAPAAHALVVLVRQVEPGARLRRGFYVPTGLLPVPDDEAVAHVLFEIATGHEPVPSTGAALAALIDKYTAVGGRA